MFSAYVFGAPRHQERTLVGSLGTGVTDDFAPPYECWESNSGPLREQHMLLTVCLPKLDLEQFIYLRPAILQYQIGKNQIFK